MSFLFIHLFLLFSFIFALSILLFGFAAHIQISWSVDVARALSLLTHIDDTMCSCCRTLRVGKYEPFANRPAYTSSVHYQANIGFYSNSIAYLHTHSLARALSLSFALTLSCSVYLWFTLNMWYEYKYTLNCIWLLKLLLLLFFSLYLAYLSALGITIYVYNWGRLHWTIRF